MHNFFTAPLPKASRNASIFWLTLSLTIAAIYAVLGLQEAFANPYVIQDDARQHVFWMQRFFDSQLFPQDIMADYFQSVAPAGYTALYQVAAKLGIDPYFFNKILPLFLALITTTYCFGVAIALLPVPLVGFVASLLLNQNLWLQDDVPSATPVAFAYPLFLAFLYYLMRRNLMLTGVAIALLGLFYPQCVFLASGLLVLQLFRWENRRFSLSKNLSDYQFSGIGLAVAFLVMLPYALKSSEYGPVLTAAEARVLWPSFFIDNPIEYWLCWRRTGIFPSEWCELSFTLPQIGFGLLLPVLLQFRDRFPLSSEITSRIRILPQLLLVSLAMFFASHALLFKLHLPSRYTEHSLRIILPLAGAIAFTLILDAIFKSVRPLPKPARGGIALFLLLVLLIYPILLRKFPDVDYKVGKFAPLYEFLAQQPSDTLIASIAEETDNLPSFTNRSILVSPTYVIGYHQRYYLELRERAIALIQAQYSANIEDVQQAIAKYGIDLWIVEQSAFTPDYLENSAWLRRFQLTETQPLFIAAQEAKASLKQGQVPALVNAIDSCAIFETNGFVILSGKCLLRS